MLALIAELYAIEREAKDADAGTRFTLRQERSLPVLARIKAWLDAEQEAVLPRSPMATAITYAQNQWHALTTYTTQGFLNIDNNASERALKRVAIGRKNWLFAGNDAAAENHARLWSLIASAERHGVDPQAYLTSVLAKIGTTPVGDVGAVPARRVETRRRGRCVNRPITHPWKDPLGLASGTHSRRLESSASTGLHRGCPPMSNSRLPKRSDQIAA